MWHDPWRIQRRSTGFSRNFTRGSWTDDKGHNSSSQRRAPRVSYGFYRDEFYAAFIKLRSPDQFSHLQRQFSKKHGKPKATFYSESGQTVYRWKVADVKIKLKIKESIGEYKLAFYYSPLAAKLNREQLEQVPPEAYGPESSKEDSTVKSAPLLEY